MVYQAEYSRKINKSCLFLNLDKDFEPDQDSIGMFRYNQIPYFLNVQLDKNNDTSRLCYDITGRRSLEQLLEYKTLGFVFLHKILSSLDQACMQAEDYLLAENDIILNPEFIFSDHESEQICYCYLPGNTSDICRQFQEFMEYLLQHLDHKDEQAVQLAYGVHQRAAVEGESFHAVLNEFRKGGESLKIYKPEEYDYEKQKIQAYTGQKKGYPKIEKQETLEQQPEVKAMQSVSRQPSMISSVKQDEGDNQVKGEEIQYSYKQYQKERGVSQQYKTEKSCKVQKMEIAKKQAGEKLKNLLRRKIYTERVQYEDEDLLERYDQQEQITSNPTVCLMPETDGIQNQFVYQGMDRTRDFQCEEGKIILGSSLEESDICIPVPMISRVHARVIVNRDQTFLEDMNSKNGTQVNGEILNYREQRKLQKGDIISLAGECYSFH